MTRDQTQQRNTITLEALAARVARAVCRFIQVSSPSVSLQSFFRLRSMQDCGGQQCMSPSWQVDRGGITTNDIILIGLLHVTQGSWQPILQLNRFIIPQSSSKW